jgi:hypothetical protein
MRKRAYEKIAARRCAAPARTLLHEAGEVRAHVRTVAYARGVSPVSAQTSAIVLR